MMTMMTIVTIVALVILPTAIAAFIAGSKDDAVEEFDYDYR